ncbi:MAG: ABC transporter substrate-binding protein, partial [Actinobacteria bacterium]
MSSAARMRPPSKDRCRRRRGTVMSRRFVVHRTGASDPSPVQKNQASPVSTLVLTNRRTGGYGPNRSRQGGLMTRRSRVVALLAALALATIGVGSGTAPAATRQAPPGQRQGITPTEIRVGGVGGFSVNPVGLPYDQIEDGVRAYFAKINSEGGVFGRQLKIIKMRDDASQPVKNLLQTRALVEQDGVFAVMPVATINFSGAKYLTKKGVPAFGYHISNDWENGPNLFGETGSATCFTCPDPTYPWLAKQLGAKRVGVIGYSVAIAQDCVKWQVASYKKFGVQVPYVNDVLAFGFTVSSFAADVQKIKDAHLDMLSTCMDS